MNTSITLEFYRLLLHKEIKNRPSFGRPQKKKGENGKCKEIEIKFLKRFWEIYSTYWTPILPVVPCQSQFWENQETCVVALILVQKQIEHLCHCLSQLWPSNSCIHPQEPTWFRVPHQQGHRNYTTDQNKWIIKDNPYKEQNFSICLNAVKDQLITTVQMQIYVSFHSTSCTKLTLLVHLNVDKP